VFVSARREIIRAHVALEPVPNRKIRTVLDRGDSQYGHI